MRVSVPILGSFLLLALPQGVCASERPSTAQRIELRGLLSSLSVRDDSLVPLAFTGPQLAFGARYGAVSGRHGVDADLRVGFGTVWNRFGHIGAHIAHGIGLTYTQALVDRTDLRFALGAALRFDTSVAYLATWDDAHAYWLASAALWPAVVDSRPLIGAAWLESRCEFALIGFGSRPPAYRANKQDALSELGYYFDRIGRSPRWLWPWQLQAIELEVLARFRQTPLAAGTGWGTGVSIRFARATFPEPYTQLYVGVVAGYGFRL